MSTESSASGRVPAATTTSLPRKGPPQAASSAEVRKSRLAAMLGEATAARTEVESTVSELTAARARVEELESELSITQDQLEAKNTALAEVTGYKDQIASDLGALRLEHEKVKEDLSGARALLGEDDEAYQKFMTELRALRAALATAKAKLATTTKVASSADRGSASAEG